MCWNQEMLLLVILTVELAGRNIHEISDSNDDVLHIKMAYECSRSD